MRAAQSNGTSFDAKFGGYNRTGGGGTDRMLDQMQNGQGQSAQQDDPLASIDTFGIAPTTSIGGDTQISQSLMSSASGVNPSFSMLSSPASTAPPTMFGVSGNKNEGPTPSAPLNNELPPGGHFYEVKIYTQQLGVMFFKPRELTDSLFLLTDRTVLESLGDRPVTAFIIEGSPARSAGVELGHVLTKVNGVEVRTPREASRLIQESARPLPLQFYQPDTTVYVAEGEHLVQYNSKSVEAPKSSKDWKPKYVVIGGIIAQPWMMNMYRSKSEYDTAVIETQARQVVSVKVKQFDLRGARMRDDWQGPQIHQYRNKMHPTRYIVVLPAYGKPIKIASHYLTQLRPVHEGIRRVIMSQQTRTQPTISQTRSQDIYSMSQQNEKHRNAPQSIGQQYSKDDIAQYSTNGRSQSRG